MRDSTIFYRSFYEAIKELPKENQLEIYNAIFEHSLNNVTPKLTGLSKTIYILIEPQIEANLKRFIDGKKGGEHGKKGGRPAKVKPQENPIGDIKENPIGNIKEYPIETPNNNNNVNNNDNYNENKNVNFIHADKKKLTEKLSHFTPPQKNKVIELFQSYFQLCKEKEKPKTKSQQEMIFEMIPEKITYEKFKLSLQNAITGAHQTIYWEKEKNFAPNVADPNIFITPKHVHR